MTGTSQNPSEQPPRTGQFQGTGLEMLHASIALLPVPASVVDLVSQRIVALNAQFAQSLHLPLESIQNRTPDELGFRSNDDDRKAVLDGTLHGRIHHTHRRTRLPDGGWVEYIDSSRRILVDGRECLLSCYEPASRLVSQAEMDRKAKEAELAQSEERLRLVLDATSDGVFDWDIASGEVYFSPGYFEMLGYAPFSFPSTFEAWRERVHTDDLANAEASIKSHFDLRTRAPYTVEFRMRHKDGSWIWILSRGKVVTRDPEGNPLRMVGTHTDITQRRVAEDKYRQLFENLLTGFVLHEVVMDPEGVVTDYRFLEMNPAYEKLTGLKSSEVIGKTVLEVLPGTEPYWITTYGKVALTGEVVRFENFSAELGRWYEALAYRPAPYQFAVLVTDVTDRKSAEVAIRQSEEMHRFLAQNSTDMISRHATDGQFLYVSPSCQDLTGRSSTEIVGRDAFFLVHADDRERIVGQLGSVLESLDPVRLEYRLNRKDGSTIWCESIAQAIRDPLDGRVLELQSSTRDITERKKNQEALKHSEEQLRIVADMSLDMLSRHDLAGICLWASPACRQILGIDPESVVGRDAFDFIVPDDHSSVQSALAQLVRFGKSRLQYRILRADGSVIWVETLWSLALDPSGNPLEIHCSTRDITEIREADRKIEELGIFNQTLLDTSGGLIVVLDLHGNVVRFNAACEELTGWKESEVVGKPFFDYFVPQSQREDVRQVFQKLSAGDFPSRYENDWITRDGSLRWIAWANSAILDDRGMVKFIVGTGLDRTEQRLAQKQILDLNDSLERRVSDRTVELQLALNELESFSYSISHDLRSPLRAIDGFSKALIEDAGPALAGDLRMYLDRIRSASQHMGQLIDDLLQLSRSSRVEIVRCEIDVSAVANQILDDFCRQSPERRLVRRIESPIAIHGDSVLVRSVLENLLGNAWKYSSLKPESVIELSSHHEDGRRWISIQDNGIGFDMAHADKLFGTFHRLHTFEQFEGTGIGLATVRKIVERHGGSVSAHAVPGHGATFRFTLDSRSRAVP